MSYFTPTEERICSHCETHFNVDRGDDIETQKCSDPNCPAQLCPCCPTFKCAGCDRCFCLEHAIEEPEPPEAPCTCERLDVDLYNTRGCASCDPDYRFKPSLFCPACMAEVEEQEWPEKIEPAAAEATLAETVGGVA